MKKNLSERYPAGEPDKGEAMLPNITGAHLEEKASKAVKIKILSKVKDVLPGGKGDARPDSDFDPEQLKKGMDDESEHTPDKAIEKEIAKDHLTMDPDYYKKLKAAGIDEYLKLTEEDQKAAVAVSELVRQLEAHKEKIWVFFDTETTGLDPNERQLTEIAALAARPDFVGGQAQVLSQYHRTIALTPETQKQMEMPFTPKYKGDKSVKDLLQMTQYHTREGNKVDEKTALEGFIKYINQLENFGDVILVAHNAEFDRKFVSVRSFKYGLEKLNNPTIDTLELAYEFFYPLLVVVDKENLLSVLKTPKGWPSFTIGAMAQALKIDNKDWHTAISDVKVLLQITQKIVTYLKQHGDLDIRRGYEKAKKLTRRMKSWKK